MRRSAALPASLVFTALALAGCGHGTVIGSGPLPTPTPIVPSVTNEFTVPTANSSPFGITEGRDGFLYFTEKTAGKIGQTSTGGTIKEFGISANGGTAGNNAYAITSGPDGNLWFTEQGPAPGVAQMLITGNKITEYHIAGSAPTFITGGPVQNTLVFSDPGNNAIGTITTAGAVSEVPIPTANANPLGITISSRDTQQVFFVENNASKIGILNVQTNTITEVPTVTPNAGPTTIVEGPDFALWFTENNVAKIGRITTTGAISEFSLAPATSAGALVTALDNNLYFGDAVQNKIGRISGITPSTVTEFAIPTANSQPGTMALGPDGRIYFTQVQGNKIGQFNY